MPARIALTRAQIAQVVAAFYARIRSHDVLGPIFAAHVSDWPAHEAKITRFWANAILADGSYSGNPMRVHMDAGNVHAQHFDTWLALFDDTLADFVAPPQRDQWSHLAHRIGRGLSLGLTEAQRPPDAVPNLRGGA